jgi:TrmH family RNA methyltransferase
MLTNKQIKLINSLHSKKGRIDNQLFLVEGEKAVLELIESKIGVEYVVTSEAFASKYNGLFEKLEVYILEEELLTKLSTLVTNSFGFAVVSTKQFNFVLEYENQVTVVLDGIRDPGNLGTIIRICDWYGINQIVMSPDCTDFFNPKSIAASMGSYARVKFIYEDLSHVFETNTTISVLGALLDGENIHEVVFPQACFLLFGNESNGVRSENLRYITRKVTIPKYGLAESLNVGVSTAIFLDNMMRN